MLMIYGATIVSKEEAVFTVFFDDESDEMPQDFESYAEAKEYAEERISMGLADSYTIEEA